MDEDQIKQKLSCIQQSNEDMQLDFINLPDDCLEIVLSYLSYDEISRNRIVRQLIGVLFFFLHTKLIIWITMLFSFLFTQVCRQFDRICKKLLNRGFNLMEKYHAQCLRSVKSKLPRRESERRSHPLARHCDILTAIETRISMLSMTFIKYVDLNVCCFIPGKVCTYIFMYKL